LLDIAYDTIFGLSEVITIKLKSFIETLAILDTFLFDDDRKNIYQRIIIHTEYQSKDNRETMTPEFHKELFETYNDTLKKKISKSEFDKKMKTSLGFLMEEPSLTKFTTDFIYKYKFTEIPYIGMNYKEYVVSNDIYAHINYLESQLMSHANGYLYFVNDGAWYSSLNYLHLFDRYIYEIIYKFKEKDVRVSESIIVLLFEFQQLINKKIEYLGDFLKNQTKI